MNESGGGLVCAFALKGEIAREIVVLIPAAMIELNEADTTFGQPASHKTIGSVGAGLLGIGAVEFERAFGFFGKIGQFRHGGLHAEGHLILRDAGADFGIAIFLFGDVVEFAE